MGAAIETVSMRLANAGLLDEFRTLIQEGKNHPAALRLEQVGIAKGWASYLCDKLKYELTLPALEINSKDVRNRGVLNSGNERKFPLCIRVSESPLDPFMSLGSHPDIVEYLWGALSSLLAENCRCIICGSPALIAPRSGIVLALGYGTQSVIRLPQGRIDEAKRSGAKSQMKFGKDKIVDLAIEFGEDWVFGSWNKREPTWMLELYEELER